MNHNEPEQVDGNMVNHGEPEKVYIEPPVSPKKSTVNHGEPEKVYSEPWWLLLALPSPSPPELTWANLSQPELS